MACEQTEKWNERWKSFLKSNKDIKKIQQHRKLPESKELFNIQMSDGTWEVRLYDKNGKYKALVKGVKASESREVYNSHKATIDGLPLIGMAAVGSSKTKKAAPKKAASKKKASTKKTATKKAASKKKAAAKKKTPAKKKAAASDPFFD